MIPISIFIITKNEANRIASVINAAKEIADEILVVDSGSNDRTCETAIQAGAKVMFNEWKGYGQQKIFGESKCRNKWILNIDADEEISHELCAEIKEIFSGNIADDVAGFRIKIVNKFPQEKKPKKWAYYYNQFRLYNCDLAGFKNSSVHDSVMLKETNHAGKGCYTKFCVWNVSCFVLRASCFGNFNPRSTRHEARGTILQLKNIIHHQSFRSYSHWIEKINSYSQMQANDAFRKDKYPSILKIFFIPIFAFFKAYFVRRYFIYGFNGLIYSYLFAFSRFAKAIKTRELFLQGKSI